MIYSRLAFKEKSFGGRMEFVTTKCMLYLVSRRQ